MSRFWQVASFAGAGGAIVALVVLIMTGSGTIVERLAIIDAERLARDVLTSIEQELELPGTPVPTALDWPDNLVALALDEIEHSHHPVDISDLPNFEARAHFSEVTGYTVFATSGEVISKGGQPRVRALNDQELQAAVRQLFTNGETHFAQFEGDDPDANLAMAVLLPLQSGSEISGLISVEIERNQLEKLMKRTVSLLATISAIAAGTIGLAGFIYVYWIAHGARSAEKEALFLANSDPATALPNRRRFNNELQNRAAATAPGHGLVLILLDIDNFKAVNDTFGHAAGDAFLSLISRRLSSFTAEGDLFRISGDQFAILRATRGGRAEIDSLMARIQTAISNQFTIGSIVTRITLSIGIAFLPEDADTGEELMRAAELALTRAKADGRNTYRFFDSEINREASDQLRFQAELAHAVKHGIGLKLAYQPQVEAATGRLVGFEALLRWEHAEFGVVPPSRFIGVAERCGIIHDLGAWALRRACNEARDWPKDLTIAVNLSPLQLRDSRLPNLIKSVLAETGIEPGRLELEVTESVMLQDTGLTHQAFKRIEALGVGLAMDDFGTGYSSLSYLTRLPLNKLKIDKAFIDRYGEARRDKAVVDAMISMARELDMKVLAEGVETKEQVDMLRRAGCTLMQGYYFGRPTSEPGKLIEKQLLGLGCELQAVAS